VRHRIEGCNSPPQFLFPAAACFDTDFVLLSMLDWPTLVPLCPEALERNGPRQRRVRNLREGRGSSGALRQAAAMLIIAREGRDYSSLPGSPRNPVNTLR